MCQQSDNCMATSKRYQYGIIIIIMISIGSVIFYILYTLNAADYQEIIYHLQHNDNEDKIYPEIQHDHDISSWKQLNEQQFCQIEPSSNAQLKLIKYILNNFFINNLGFYVSKP